MQANELNPAINLGFQQLVLNQQHSNTPDNLFISSNAFQEINRDMMNLTKKMQIEGHFFKFPDNSSDGKELINELSSNESVSVNKNNRSNLCNSSKKITKIASKDRREGGKRSRLTWDSEEDQCLLDLVNQHGLKWSLISQKMEGMRTGKQIRERYLNKLDPAIKACKWEKNEDKQLLELFSIYGRKWREISKLMPGRTESMVKNRLASMTKVVSAEKSLSSEAKEETVSHPLGVYTHLVKKDVGISQSLPNIVSNQLPSHSDHIEECSNHSRHIGSKENVANNNIQRQGKFENVLIQQPLVMATLDQVSKMDNLFEGLLRRLVEENIAISKNNYELLPAWKILVPKVDSTSSREMNFFDYNMPLLTKEDPLSRLEFECERMNPVNSKIKMDAPTSFTQGSTSTFNANDESEVCFSNLNATIVGTDSACQKQVSSTREERVQFLRNQFAWAKQVVIESIEELQSFD